MFESAEIGRAVTPQEFEKRAPRLRERLLNAQRQLADADFPVIVLFAGVDGAGKGGMANTLCWWMDPRQIRTHAYERPIGADRERPEWGRFWRDLPQNGHMSIVLSGWYSKPILQRAYDRIDDAEFEHRLNRIVAFETMLAADGALIVKFWMHLGREQQEQRLQELERDPLTAWRVKPRDWEHWAMYDRFVDAGERLISRTSSPVPWHIVEGTDQAYRELKVGALLLEVLETRLAKHRLQLEQAQEPPTANEPGPEAETRIGVADLLPSEHARTVLETLDLSRSMGHEKYTEELVRLHARMNELHRRAGDAGLPVIVIFEGSDAAGKGGCIRRLVHAIDARSYEVVSIGPPTVEEKAHHYLWRFWNAVPRNGRFTVFDRSWYGRVLVERVEGFATREEWSRAYAEINDFERELLDYGTLIVKFWLEVSEEEQLRRFKARAKTPHKRWKLTEEDVRNREKRSEYSEAVGEMLTRTGTTRAPWILIEADDKRYARIRVMEEVCSALGRALEERHGPPIQTSEEPTERA